VNAFSFEGTITHGDQRYERMKAQAHGEIPFDDRILKRAPGEHARLLEILDALDNDQRKCFSANLPDGAVLELTCVATGRGLRPLQVPDFPDTLAAPLARKVSAQALTVESALTGDRRLFVEALLADGAVTERTTAEKLADELLQAQRQYLPQFA